MLKICKNIQVYQGYEINLIDNLITIVKEISNKCVNNIRKGRYHIFFVNRRSFYGFHKIFQVDVF